MAAREAESAPLLAHAMVQQAFVLTDVGDVHGAVDLVREAQGVAKTKVPPIMSAWLWASEGEVLAAVDDATGSCRAFDRATRHLPPSGHSELAYLQLDEKHLARWHGNVLAKLGDPAAVDRLYAGLDAPDQSLRASAALQPISPMRSPRRAITVRPSSTCGRPPASPSGQVVCGSDDASGS